VTSDTSLISEAEEMALGAQPDVVTSETSPIIFEAEDTTLAQPDVTTSDTSLLPSKNRCVSLHEQGGMYLTSFVL
jgi:hypothetical protein